MHVNKKYTEAPFEGPPPLAAVYFQRLIDEKLLRPWFMDPARLDGLGAEKRESLYISFFDYLRNGFTSPRVYVYYYALRSEIHPALWFYGEAEAARARGARPFCPVHPPGHDRLSMTLALRYLEYRRDTDGLRAYASRLGLPQDTLKNIFYRKRSRGESDARFGRPTAPLIRRLMPDIPPEDWFIFPDEARLSARGRRQPPVTPGPVIDFIERAGRRS